MAIIYLAAGNVLPMFQADAADRPATLKIGIFNDTFALVGNVAISMTPTHAFVNQTLGLVQAVNYNPKPFILNANFPVSHVVSRSAITLDVNSYFAIRDASRPVTVASGSNQLTFSQALTVRRAFTNAFNVTQVATYVIARVAVADNAFEIRSSVAVYLHGKPGFVAISFPEAPTNFNRIQLSLGGDTITVDVPKFGDTDEIEHLRINRETRAGERIIYKDPMWPIVERLHYSFDNLDQIKAKNLMDFMTRTLGRTITLVDHYGITWNVVLTNPEAEFSQQDRCSFSGELQFEGSRA